MAEFLIRARLATAAAGVLLVGSVAIGATPITVQAQAQVDVVGSSGSGAFGSDVLVLSNGNYVVADPQFDSGALQDVGAVHLYNGTTNQVISTITGSQDSDFIGEGGLKEVGNSNFVILSPSWQNGVTVGAGAVTWVSGTLGLNGHVTVANSLVGTTSFDSVGIDGVTVLTNGNYVVDSSVWAGVDLGAATWGNGNIGVSGAVSSSNSLVGALALDAVGVDGVTALTNGNYVVGSGDWSNGNSKPNAGAVTWGDGTIGTHGVVGTANSLVGNSPDDIVGTTTLGSGVTPLANGNYAVASSFWDNGGSVDVGAVTWASGTGPTAATVNPSNSIIGTTANDNVGSGGVTALTNNNYVVASPLWDGAAVDVGAVTWAGGGGVTSATVAAGNSIVGSTLDDNVGSGGVTALKVNGNYVVSSPLWDNGAVADAGAVTRASGTSATSAVVSSGNSLVGSTASDGVGGNLVGAGLVTALTNGNYVVNSPLWDNGATADVGAVTWRSGTTGVNGPVTPANSLVGGTVDDQVGLDGTTALTNGNYVVDSSQWDRVSPAVADAGAVTWADGTTGLTGVVAVGNSIVGAVALDSVGLDGVTALTNGNYVVVSGDWHNGISNPSAGAVTWATGSGPTSATVTSANSLVGTKPADFVGTLLSGSGVKALAGGAYVVVSDAWDNGAVSDVGAATYGPVGGITGAVTAANSALGTPGTSAGVVLAAADGLTAAGAVAINTTQNRVLLLQTDTTAPVFGAPHADITVDAAPGATSQVVTFTPPTATDNIGTPSVACAPASGTAFAVGATTVTCTATDGAGNKATSAFKVTVTATPAVTPSGTPADYVPLAPARLADTRPGETTIDSLFAGEGARSGGSTLELTVAGRGGVAADATAVALNVTAVTPSGDGYVTVFPCGSDRPTASNVNYTSGAVIPNAVVAKIGTAGKVCFFVSAATHLVIDANGYFPTTTTLHPLNPARLLETRSGLATVDGFQQSEGAREAGSITEVQVTDRATVTSDAAAAVLNITITEAKAPGFATVYPCGIPRPLASTINYDTGSTVANLVVSKIGTDGKVCIFTQAAAHILADVNGYFPVATSYHPLVPARLLETRPGESTVDGVSQGAGLLPSRTVTEVTVTGRGGVPAGAASVVLNVTVTGPTQAGFVTVYPCGIEPPLASNLNYGVGTTAANAVIVKVGTGGKVCVYNSNPTQLIADVNGYFPA